MNGLKGIPVARTLLWKRRSYRPPPRNFDPVRGNRTKAACELVSPFAVPRNECPGLGRQFMAQPPLQKWLGHFLLHRPQRELGMQSVIQETADSHRPHGTGFRPTRGLATSGVMRDPLPVVSPQPIEFNWPRQSGPGALGGTGAGSNHAAGLERPRANTSSIAPTSAWPSTSFSRALTGAPLVGTRGGPASQRSSA